MALHAIDALGDAITATKEYRPTGPAEWLWLALVTLLVGGVGISLPNGGGPGGAGALDDAGDPGTGGEFPADEMYYADDGGMLCMQCESARDVASGFRNSYMGMATGALGLSLLSICFNFFFIPSILAIVAGIQTLRFPKSLSPEDRQSINDLNWVPAVAVIAIIIAGGKGLLSLLAMFGALAM